MNRSPGRGDKGSYRGSETRGGNLGIYAGHSCGLRFSRLSEANAYMNVGLNFMDNRKHRIAVES